MTDRLSLYNGALRICGERKLASLAENREPRRLLDDVWDGGAVDYCLEQGFWNFATRATQLDYDAGIDPEFGYKFAFGKPDDYVRTAAVCSDEFFNSPIVQYSDETDYWFCDLQTIWVKFISDDDAYGYNFGKWPQTFVLYAEHYLANSIAPKLTSSESKALKIEKGMKKALVDARSKDAMNEPAKFLPQGTWVGARYGRSGYRRDRARGSLIG